MYWLLKCTNATVQRLKWRAVFDDIRPDAKIEISLAGIISKNEFCSLCFGLEVFDEGVFDT